MNTNIANNFFFFLEKDKQDDGRMNGVTSDKVSDILAELFAGDLNPVAPKAQKKVPIPDG